jgi:hypothetical protein
MRGRGRWRAALAAAVVVLLAVALTGAGVSPVPFPATAAADPTTPSAPAAPGSTTVDAIATAVVEAQATAEAEAAAEVAASAEAVTSAVGAVDALAEAGVWVGVAVLDRVTGEMAVGAEGAKPIAAASLTKLYTVVDVLTRAAAGQIALTDADQRLIRRTLTTSDDGAMNALWSRFGRSATVAGAVAVAGLGQQAAVRPIAVG